MTDNEVPQWLSPTDAKTFRHFADAAQRQLLRDIAERNRAGFLSLPGNYYVPETKQAWCAKCGFQDASSPHGPDCPHTIWAPLLAGVPGAQP